MHRTVFKLCVCLFLLSGCINLKALPPATGASQATPQAITTAQTALAATPTAIYPWTDESAVMDGICFEAAQNAAGKVFVLRNDADLNNLYAQADNSHLCRHPVTRTPFDFSTGRILVGLWSSGNGCTAQHDVVAVQRDDANKRMTIILHFVTSGTCDYELVRPFWIGLDGIGDYNIQLVIQ